MRKTLAFDIDGTLINRKGELLPEVFPIFQNKKIIDCNLIFATGNFKSTTQALWEKLIFNFPYMKSMKPYFASATGSIIYNPDGKILYEYYLDKEKLIKIIKEIYKIDPDCDLLFGTENMVYVPYPKTDKKVADFEAFIQHEKNKGELGIPLTMEHKTAEQIINGKEDVLCIFIFNCTKKEIVYPLLLKEFNKEEYGIYWDKFLDIISMTAGTKWKALKTIVDCEKKHPILQDFTTNPKDIYYFGDDANDIECLKNCKFSVARGGERLKQEVIESGKYHADDLTEITKIIFEEK